VDVIHLTCTSCGAPLPAPEDADQVTCPYCSTTVLVNRPKDHGTIRSAMPFPAREWRTVLVLCAVTGWLGAHRFYTGHVLIGAVQLATSGGFYLWWLTDLFLILTGRFRDSQGNRLLGVDVALGHGCMWALLAFGVVLFVGMIAASIAKRDACTAAAVLGAVVAAGIAFAVGRQLGLRRERPPS